MKTEPTDEDWKLKDQWVHELWLEHILSAVIQKPFVVTENNFQAWT